MIELKNLMFQPLTLHLAGSGKGLHLSPREWKRIQDAELSPEIELAAKRGFVLLNRIAEEATAAPTTPATKTATATTAPSDVPAATVVSPEALAATPPPPADPPGAAEPAPPTDDPAAGRRKRR